MNAANANIIRFDTSVLTDQDNRLGVDVVLAAGTPCTTLFIAIKDNSKFAVPFIFPACSQPETNEV